MRQDDEFDRVVARHRARTPRQVALYLVLGMLPGLLAYVGVWHLWHIFTVGYYGFPAAILALVVVGNFVGEEVYFHGYLLQKLDGVRVAGLRVHWLVVGVVFQAYHVWQLPLNLSFLGLVPILPFGILVMLRRSLYGTIAFHASFNMAYFPLIFLLFGYGPGQ